MAPENTTLAVHGVGVRYGGLVAVKNCSFTVAPAQVTLMTGHNGAGKTSCVRAIAGLVPLSTGTVSVEIGGARTDFERVSPRELTKRGVSLVPTGNAVFPALSVADNLRAASLGAAGKGSRVDWVLHEMFPALGQIGRRMAGALSGGERQQLAIALSLVQRPRVLILDEPTNGVSPSVAQQIARALRELAEEGCGVLIVEQNLNAFLTVADRVLVLNRGEVRHDGSARDISVEQLWSMF